VFLLSFQFSCKKDNKYHDPGLETVVNTIQTCAAVGYCASIAVAAYCGENLPSNVIYEPSSKLIFINISKGFPLPFNKNIGQIVIAGVWQNNGGVISILLSDIDLLNAKFKIYGLHTIPLKVSENGKKIFTVFARQDIIIGNGNDTLLDMSNISGIALSEELSRLDNTHPTDIFVAVKQHVWFMDVDRKGVGIQDDAVFVNGGGQIVEVEDNNGGIIYSAMLNTELCPAKCTRNPVKGNALIQNFKVGETLLPDVSNACFSFYQSCNGGVHVDFASGKYSKSADTYLPLGL
jgi:hypothetical protein